MFCFRYQLLQYFYACEVAYDPTSTKCTIDQELALVRRFVSLTRYQHFSAWNDIMAAVLKLWCQIWKSDSFNQCVFIWRTFLPNVIPIRFETPEP